MYIPISEAGDITWVNKYPDCINDDWYYFRWPHSETEEEYTHRQRRVGDYLEIQNMQNNVWTTIKYLSLVKIPLMEVK
jgi:hypothetical protein